VSALIDKKFINMLSPQLQRFKWKTAVLGNCRCPICGDSQKNLKKARGFFFKKANNFFFKCHNCGAGHTTYKLLEILSPALCRDYSLEVWKEGESSRAISSTEPIEIFKPNIVINLPRITDLEPTHAARKYMESRKIPKLYTFYFTTEFGAWVKGIDPTYSTLPDDERIVIPFRNKDGQLLGVQGRAIGGSKNSIRYITVKFVKDGRMIFGGDTVDYSRRVYATEGPFDSAFLDNGIAFAGSEIGDVTRGFRDIVVVLDNEPRNAEIVRATKDAINSGHTVCVWEDGIAEKDINDMVLYGRSSTQVQSIIDRCSCSGIEAQLKWTKWKRI